jgi:hypothetical protein
MLGPGLAMMGLRRGGKSFAAIVIPGRVNKRFVPKCGDSASIINSLKESDCD